MQGSMLWQEHANPCEDRHHWRRQHTAHHANRQYSLDQPVTQRHASHNGERRQGYRADAFHLHARRLADRHRDTRQRQ